MIRMPGTLLGLPLWCIVQGDGDKASATPSGSVPLQYFSWGNEVPPMRASLNRAVSVAGARRVIATVADAHEGWWHDPLRRIPPQHRVVDELTGRHTITLTAALAIIERITEEALVVVQPADRFLASDASFMAGVRRATAALTDLPGHVIAFTLRSYLHTPGQDYLLAAPADGLPGRLALRFVKRPEPVVADQLIKRGALLSLGVYVSRLTTLMGILADFWPDLVEAARTLAIDSAAHLRTPARMPGSRFTRPWRHTWVQRPLPRLRALPVEDLNWIPTLDARIEASPRSAAPGPNAVH